MIKKIIKIALYFILVVGIFGVIMDSISSNLRGAFGSFVWLGISAVFIERIRKEKIGKLGWILAGIFALLGIVLFVVGFLTVLFIQ